MDPITHAASGAVAMLAMPNRPASRWAVPLAALAAAFRQAKATKGKPTVLIARTVKGKGVSFMEGKPAWHGKAPNAQELSAALAELQ